MSGTDVEQAVTSTIEVRRPGFAWPDELDLLPISDDPEASCELLALSFTLPYLEPYLIRTMRTATKLVDDPALVADMKAFSGQEAQHHREHSRVNDLVRSRLTPQQSTAMRSLEDDLDADYRRFTDTRSVRFNLAYAEGFEAMTFALARSMIDGDATASADPVWERLVLWHLSEEVEHRTVTFDAYDHVVGNWPLRCVVGTWAQVHFLRYVMAMATVCRNDLVPDAATVRQSTIFSIKRHLRLGTIQSTARALSPTYDPRNVVLSDRLVDIAERHGVALA